MMLKLWLETRYPTESYVSSSEKDLILYRVEFIHKAFTLNFKQGYELEQYKQQTQMFLEAGVDHYLAKMGSNIGMSMLNNMLYFSERPDLECRLALTQASVEPFP